jgi:hypothetical protein
MPARAAPQDWLLRACCSAQKQQPGAAQAQQACSAPRDTATRTQRTARSSLSLKTTGTAATPSACCHAGTCAHARGTYTSPQAAKRQPHQVPTPASKGRTATHKHSAATQASTNNGTATKHPCRCSTSQQRHHYAANTQVQQCQHSNKQLQKHPPRQRAQRHQPGCCWHAVAYRQRSQAPQRHNSPPRRRTPLGGGCLLSPTPRTPGPRAARECQVAERPGTPHRGASGSVPYLYIYSQQPRSAPRNAATCAQPA